MTTIEDILRKNGVNFQPIDISHISFLMSLQLPDKVQNYLQCMGTAIKYHETNRGSAWTTLYNIKDLVEHQHPACNKNNLLVMEFPFYDAPNTAAIICCHIMESKSPILYVSHDEDDGMWQFLCGQVHTTDEAKLVSLRWVFDFDHSVGVLADMPCGYYAQRKNRDDSWTIKKR